MALTEDSPFLLKTLCIFISSPGDVAEEREKARQVIVALQQQYGDAVRLLPVLWEDLLLPATSSFQGIIDHIVLGQRIDIAVFLLWSRLGTPVGPPTAKDDGTPYRRKLKDSRFQHALSKNPGFEYYPQAGQPTNRGRTQILVPTSLVAMFPETCRATILATP